MALVVATFKWFSLGKTKSPKWNRYIFICLFFSTAMKCKINTQSKKLYLDNHCYKCIAPELGACISPFSAVHPGLCHRSSSNCISLLPLFPAQAEVLLSLPRDMILAACLVPKASSQNLSCRRYPGGIPVKCLNNRIAPFDAEHQRLWHTPQRPICPSCLRYLSLSVTSHSSWPYVKVGA